MANDGRNDLNDFLQKARSGDRAAFSEIVKRMMKPVVAMIYRMTQDRDSAVDLAQDTFVSAWQNLSTFRGDAKLESWLFAIAGNKTLNYLQSRAVRGRESFDDHTESMTTTAGPDDELTRRELREHVFQFMQSLPDQQKLVFELRFYQQLTFDEIADATGKAVGTVKTHYREAVKKLREFAIERGWRS
jgi:RNA polymerase sigma-70 factor (ECF subfamily)